MKPGDIVITTNIQQHLGNGNFVYLRSDRGQYMVFVFVGSISKETATPQTLREKVESFLVGIGWKKSKKVKENKDVR